MSVIVALMLVALLGFGAMAVDVGMMYAERTQLRNGADAAALAIAQKCARSAADPDCIKAKPLATTFANQNANDSLSNIKSFVLDTDNRSVALTVGAQEGVHTPNQVSLFFARALGINATEVTAPSSARWGSPLEGPTLFPLTFSLCQVNGMVGAGQQLLESRGSTLTSKKTSSCVVDGKTVPGGFGWLKQIDGQCGGYINLSLGASGSETGNDAPSNCEQTLTKWATTLTSGGKITLLLPVYTSVTGTGTSAVYSLSAFAAFDVVGWRFASGDNGTNAALIFHNKVADVGAGLACTGDCRGIIGGFVKYVSLAEGYKLGPVNSYGATVVELTS
ncbi:pilus assembly protein TadG-related protein [Pseudarthrobacter siccitolerans]|uniref:pilus assembly protein TadG-related protein n=1 Tax=Pseudarthrobacter siccitolerans TaxID=861266 RepID=UPI0027BA345F|nr:pilus assembly protein TadG-related protein [Pseudarthrobacter siccitolerans]